MSQRATVIVSNGSKIALIRRTKNGETYYAIPGGKIEPGETPQLAAIREIKEELNISITNLVQVGLEKGEDRVDYIFTAQTLDEKLEIIGIELERTNETNIYHPVWVTKESIEDLEINPPACAKYLLEILK